MLKKVGGGFLVLFGIVGFTTLADEFSIIALVLSIASIYLGYKLFKGKPKKKVVAKPVPSVSKAPTIKKTIDNPKQDKKHHYFRVAGISKKNDRNEDIQKLIKEFVAEEIEMGHVEKYEDMSNSEILEYGEEVYEADIYGYHEIKLVPEPTNQYDPNAIQIIHEDIGHIGYVPKEEIDKVKSIMLGEYDLEWKLLGGKFKYVDEDEYKVRTKTLSYGVAIDLYY